MSFCLYVTSGISEEKVRIFWPFYTFWTRVAITAPRRPKRAKPGSKTAWVLGNQPGAGFARRFGRLTRQHVRCGAHMFPPVSRPKKCAWGAKQHASAATFHSQYSRANEGSGLGLRAGGRKSANNARFSEMVTKTAGGFRRVGDIWVGAEGHFESAKPGLRAGLD